MGAGGGTFLSFYDADGRPQRVSADNPLPVSGAGGGGMEPADISAEAPATWDEETSTIGVDQAAIVTAAVAAVPSGAAAATPSLRAIGATATTVVAGNDSRLTNTRTPTDNTVSTAKIVDANVTEVKLAGAVTTKLNRQGAAVADATDEASAVTQVNALLASLRAAGLIAT